MKILSTNQLPLLAGFLFAVLAVPVQANLSWTFTTETNPDEGSCTSAIEGNNCTVIARDTTTTKDSQGLYSVYKDSNGKTVNVKATAWSSSTSTVTSTLQTAILNMYDGLAVNAQGETTQAPEHATDNNSKLESILFSFDKAISLQSITMGWHQDADFSLLRYTSSSTLTNFTNTASNQYSELIANGWELVGNYSYSATKGTSNTAYTATDYSYKSTVGSETANSDITAMISNINLTNNGALSKTDTYTYVNSKPLNNVSKDLSSSYWLVVARSDVFSNFWSGDGTSTGKIADYFKIKNLTGAVKTTPPPNTQVPEPSSLLLLLIGGFLAWKIHTAMPSAGQQLVA